MTPPLAVSMGDPAGIGLELALKGWRAGAPPFFLIGDVAAARALDLAPVEEIASPQAAAAIHPRALPVLPEPLEAPLAHGRPDPRHAPAIVRAIERGVRFCLDGTASALVTMPIAKAPLYEAGFAFPGHTEFVAALTAPAPMAGARGPVMMLAGASLKVALATIHAPLSAVPGLLTQDLVAQIGRVTAQALTRDFAVARPRLAFCGLNPHAGEGGALGREEGDIIAPALEALRAEGIDARGPFPADSLFHPEARAGYDAAIAMYHDQGLIPLKTLHFWDGVNLTLGLPIVRASPDHGVGYDIAGKGRARVDSTLSALRLAAEIAARRSAAA